MDGAKQNLHVVEPDSKAAGNLPRDDARPAGSPHVHRESGKQSVHGRVRRIQCEAVKVVGGVVNVEPVRELITTRQLQMTHPSVPAFRRCMAQAEN